ncbi:hypothetical protein RRG08_050740 [Elysia crispata]|uniref:Uncharacterized protein n=1 Tax=Elysia crispata TaxID=231223 RepID=A0AAE0ZRF1_9GAST|nr:hypothetical protein RRG08_050740 [Elysia crispata]
MYSDGELKIRLFDKNLSSDDVLDAMYSDEQNPDDQPGFIRNILDTMTGESSVDFRTITKEMRTPAVFDVYAVIKSQT